MKKHLLRKVHWKHLLLFFACLASINQVYAQYYDFMSDNDGVTIYYQIKGKSAVVVYGDKKYAGNISIPSSVTFDGKDYSVTEISSFAFEECVDLESIDFPQSLEFIGTYAFYGCTTLRSLSIPNKVENIGYNAFQGCSNINTISLPSSLKSIERNTFDGCRNLRAISIPYGVRRIGSCAFMNCRMMASVSIPNSVNTIESFAFEGCSSLSSLTLPDQLTSLEVYAFAGCSRLSSLVIPNSVTSIEEDAFMNCSGLKSISIPNSVEFIGDWAFTGCKSIQSVITEIDNPFAIGSYVFERDVKKNAVLHVPNGLKSVYKETSGWDFFNIEEELQSNFNLVLWGKDGEKIATYALSNKPKIIFSQTEMTILSENIEVRHQNLSELSRFTYENDTESGIFNLLTEDKYLFNGESVLFPSLKANSIICVYSLSGTCVINKTTQQSGTYAIPISHLQSGVYIIKVNSLTFKILKK